MTNPVLSPPLDEVTTAVLTLLRTSGRTVHDAVYTGDPITPVYPYSILYALFGGDTNPMPDLDDRHDSVTLPFQVTSVSNLRNQTQRIGRELRDRLVGKSPAGGYAYPLVMPTGWVCIDRRPDPAVPGVDRTGDTPTAVFSQPARYLLTICPA